MEPIDSDLDLDLELKDFDDTILENHKWAFDFKNSVLNLTNKYLLNWCQIVIELGENEIDLEEWIRIYTKNIQETHRDLFKDVKKMKYDVIDKISEIMKRSRELTYVLGLDSQDYDVDLNLNENLYNVRKVISQKSAELEKHYLEKKKELDILIEKQNQLCKILDETPCALSSKLKLNTQFELLHQKIESLDQMRYEREENYLKLKDSIQQMAKKLHFAPNSSFEQEILSTNSSKEMNITKENMMKLEELNSHLSKQISNMKEEIDHLKSKAEHLWSVLEESIRERESFLEKYQGYSIQTLNALRAEVKRCEASKKANIRIFVEKTKKEIKDLLRICYRTDELTNQEPWFNSDVYSEDLLDLHEMELARWRNYYSANEQLLKLFAEYEKSWNQLLQLENTENDGMNRFKNRGGQLLKEEKERNKLNKRIPIIEEKIKQLAMEYEEEHGKPFLISGEPILNYIDNLHYQKDEEKKNKLSARKQKPTPMKERVTPAKSCVSLFPSSSRLITTPQKSVRKLLPSSSIKRTTSTKKKLSPVENKYMKVKKTITKAKDNLNLSTVSQEALNKSRRLSKERSKRIARCAKYLNMMPKMNKENLDMTNYDTFEKNLSSREDKCRSTLAGVGAICNQTIMIPAIVLIPSTPTNQESAKKNRK